MTNEEVFSRAYDEVRLRGLSPKTVESYLGRLKLFLKYFNERPIEGMNEIEIREYLLYLLDSGHSAGSVNVCNSALRFIFGAVLGQNLNYQLIHRRREHREFPALMSKKELAHFFSSMDNLRDRAMFETVYGAGLRLSEITYLRAQDIDSQQMRIFVHHGKGGKDRYTLLSQRNLEVLRGYWREYRPNHPEGYLFYPRKQRQKTLTPRSVANAFRNCCKNAGLPDTYTVHTLRHCFATHLLESGAEVCQIKELLGHTFIQTTAFYLHIGNMNKQIQSPLDSLPKKQYGEGYRQSHRRSMAQHKAMNAILNCRTAKLGGHMDNCPECGYQRPSYNSCRNRHCPKCQTLSKERWIDAQKGNLLNVGYFHVVFTVPQELNLWIYRKQQDCYNLLFRCVAETIQELSADKKYLGATTGHTAVLHTWGQNLSFHPHIHCIVPAGGLTQLSKWVPSRKNFFIPVKVLSRKCRGKFLSLLKQRFPSIELSVLNECYHKEWVVYCKPPFKDAACVVEYLGRYTHRVAISNNRILKLDDGQVSFRWRDYRDSSCWKEMSLRAEEFIRRFLMHVLPSGFTKIRHYGFLSSRGKQKNLHICKVQTGTSLKKREKLSTEALIQKILGRKPSQCPNCGFCGLLRTGLAPPTAY